MRPDEKHERPWPFFILSLCRALGLGLWFAQGLLIISWRGGGEDKGFDMSSLHHPSFGLQGQSDYQRPVQTPERKGTGPLRSLHQRVKRRRLHGPVHLSGGFSAPDTLGCLLPHPHHFFILGLFHLLCHSKEKESGEWQRKEKPRMKMWIGERPARILCCLSSTTSFTPLFLIVIYLLPVLKPLPLVYPDGLRGKK